MPTHPGLSNNALGLLNYLHGTLTQPVGSWEGFYRPQSDSMNFALRYQLAFSTYALAALQAATPAYHTPYAAAMRAAIEKMLHPDVWSYWRAPQQDSRAQDAPGGAGHGHIAVLAAPHARTVSGMSSDPIAHNNLQYSGHLSTMLGLYEKASGDSRYDEPFTLEDTSSGAAYTYTHSKVAERIHAQMLQNRFGGVCCEQGVAYVPCNNHAMASNTLHDALHGTQYRKANAGWLKTVRDKLVLKGPALRGVFGTAYMKDLGLATPVAFNFTDVWGLAFMVPFSRPLVRRLYSRFKKRGVSKAGSEGAYVGSSNMSDRMEISDEAINTGFGLILARAIGDERLAGELLRYATKAYAAGWQGASYSYTAAPRTLHATSLYALAAAIEQGGEGFVRLFNDPPRPRATAEPYLASVESDSAASIGVSQAYFEPASRALHISLRQVGDPAALLSSHAARVRLVIGNVDSDILVEPGVAYKRLEDGTISLDVRVAPHEETALKLQLT